MTNDDNALDEELRIIVEPGHVHHVKSDEQDQHAGNGAADAADTPLKGSTAENYRGKDVELQSPSRQTCLILPIGPEVRCRRTTPTPRIGRRPRA